MPHTKYLQFFVLLMLCLASTVVATPDGESGIRSHLADEHGAEPASEDGEPPSSGLPGRLVRLSEAVGASLLIASGQEGLYQPSPALSTEVVIRVSGLVARAEVSQRFTNPTEDWVEGVYVFPLPEKAAVDTLRMQIGDRIVVGRIHEKEAAQKVYTEAKSEGKKASLVSQKRPNVFSLSLANIGPGETIEVTIGYQQEVRYGNGHFELRFPMTIRERYQPAAGAPSAATMDNPENPTPPSYGDPSPLALAVALEIGLPLAKVESPSHGIQVEKRALGHRWVELAGSQVPADRDFVLRWSLAAKSVPQAAVFREDHGDATYLLMMVAPPPVDQVVRLPRESIFVIDVSGSMNGTSIRQARQALMLALDRLEGKDGFNIIAFNGKYRTLFSSSRPATSENLNEARRFVSRLEADGGTEMLPALVEALRSGGGWDLRQVIFITDGAVGNEAQLFAEIESHLGDSRLFTVGIGSAPNNYFMRKAAELGRGTYTLISDLGEVGKRMGELFHKLESPVMTDLEVLWDDPLAESWPERLPDLYAGEPVLLAARLPNGPSGVRIDGWLDGQPWDQTLTPGKGLPGAGIHRLWARRKVEALGDRLRAGAPPEEVRRQVVEVALAHGILSPYTSMVAVDETPSAPAGSEPVRRVIPAARPAGSGQLPSGGTAAWLEVLLGVLLLGLAFRWTGLAHRRRP